MARSNAAIHAALSRVADDEDRWSGAVRQDGDERPGSAVAELTDVVELSGWPEGTRLIVRREPLHPGAQTSLFPSMEFRYWGHYTDAKGDAVLLDADMRAHAHVEDHIRRLKASGLERFPFADLDANRAWMATVCFAADLVWWAGSSPLARPVDRGQFSGGVDTRCADRSQVSGSVPSRSVRTFCARTEAENRRSVQLGDGQGRSPIDQPVCGW